MRRTVWHGTEQEAIDLLAVIDRHCACRVDARGVRSATCPAHRMLVEDQRALDGLLFVRGQHERFVRREWDAAEESLPPYYFTPTDRSAASVEEFLAVCRAEPDVAATHFQLGWFEPWLRHIGRGDLAELTVRLRGSEVDHFVQAAVRSDVGALLGG